MSEPGVEVPGMLAPPSQEGVGFGQPSASPSPVPSTPQDAEPGGFVQPQDLLTLVASARPGTPLPEILARALEGDLAAAATVQFKVPANPPRGPGRDPRGGHGGAPGAGGDLPLGEGFKAGPKKKNPFEDPSKTPENPGGDDFPTSDDLARYDALVFEQFKWSCVFTRDGQPITGILTPLPDDALEVYWEETYPGSQKSHVAAKFNYQKLQKALNDTGAGKVVPGITDPKTGDVVFNDLTELTGELKDSSAATSQSAPTTAKGGPPKTSPRKAAENIWDKHKQDFEDLKKVVFTWPGYQPPKAK